MRVAVFNTKPYDRQFFNAANERFSHQLTFFEARLDHSTVALAHGFPAVCPFVNDHLGHHILERLKAGGTRLIALRSAGYNNVDLAAAEALGLDVVRVPAYSPHSVAEFTVALLLALDRRIPRAWTRVRDNNFSLDGLMGNDLCRRKVGVVGTGRIGALVARILKLGFGCDVIAHDRVEDLALVAMGIAYRPLDELIAEVDVLSLHCPLTPATHHLVDAAAIAAMKPGVLVVNTSRGALIDAEALIEGLKSGKIGGVALDVYEQEADLFFEDLSNEIIHDDVFQRLLTFPNVLVTGHQAFFTADALSAIAETTLANIADFEARRALGNRVSLATVSGRPAG